MKVTVKIEKVNYFGESTGTNDFNAKVLYHKNGKLYLAHIYVDFFNRRVYESKQPKEGKVLAGLISAVNEFAAKTNWMF